MKANVSGLYRRSFLTLVAAVALLSLAPAQARVMKIVIDTKTSPAFDGQVFGDAGQYETIAGLAYGELDPRDPLNAIITDIELAPRTRTATSNTSPLSFS